MISRLTGILYRVDLSSLILDVRGVGYRVYISSDTRAGLHPRTGEQISLWTHLAVREDALDLYGFLEEDELRLFEMLISVSGIGPKSALAILSLASATLLRKAVAGGEISYLTKVSGIGKKTAEKIMLELRDKIGESPETSEELKGDADVVEALKSLGYSHSEARDAVRGLNDTVSGTSERIKEALKKLSHS